MKTLIVYYSHTANNELLARELREKLACDIFRIEERGKRTNFRIMLDLIFNRRPKLKPYALSLRDYDQLICIAPVWGGKAASPLRSFLENERNNFGRYSFISICGGGGSAQEEKITNDLTALTNRKPDAVKQLSIGALVPEQSKESILKYRISSADLVSFIGQLEEFIYANDVLAGVQ